ncbi:MAG: alpha/beta fold hydrolase [Planctomycetota bacterium]
MTTRAVLSALVAALVACACESIPERSRPAADRVRDEIAEVNGTKLAWKSYGSGERAIVFVQGAQLAREMWEDQARNLAEPKVFAERRRTVFYDVRGFGKSGPMTEPFSHENDLRALLDALEIERATLVGLSLGGRIAIEFAVEHPERVEALVLVGPGLLGFPFKEEPEAWHDEIRAAIQARDGARAVEAWLSSGYMLPAMQNPELASKLRKLALANTANWLQTDFEIPLDPAAIGRLSTIRCPTLVLVGSRDVPEMHAIADHLDREIPNSRKAVIAASGHVPNLERPMEFERLVREFLAEARPLEKP